MGSLDGKVAFITGGARGQGRSHAVALAREGAAIALCDRCEDLEEVPYPLATKEDLEETAEMVRAEGVACTTAQCDVSDLGQVQQVVNDALAAHRRIDILLANAGVSSGTSVQDTSARLWDQVVGTNLTGVFNSIRAVAPTMIEQRYGRIVATSSMMGRMGSPGLAAYAASKWGVIGLVKSAAQDLAAFGITVNAVAPGNIATPMVMNDALFRVVRPDLEHPTAEDAAPVLQALQVIPVPWFAPEEVTKAILYLISADYMTGAVIDISAGASARFTA